jgi:outer membrane murein-binding lipoprotein Lpp
VPWQRRLERRWKNVWLARRNDVQRIFYVIAIITVLLLCGCASRPAVDAWEDASLVAEQRAEIEQLQRDIVILRTQLGDAQQFTQSSIESIDRAYAELESSLAGTENLQGSIDALTEFARQCLAEISRLREYQSENIGVQSTNRGTDAG